MTINFSRWWNGAGWASLMTTIIGCCLYVHAENKYLCERLDTSIHQVNQRIDDVNKRSDDLHKEFYSLLKEMNKKHG